MFQCRFRLALALAFAVFAADASALAKVSVEPPRFAGPFHMRQYLALYVVNPEGLEFTIDLNWREDARAFMDRPLLIRVFDPDERLLIRHDSPGVKRPEVSERVRLTVPASGAGVYQVAITGFRPTLEFSTDPPLSFGMFGYPELAVDGEQFADSFIHIPPALKTLTVRGGEAIQSVRVTDAADARLNLEGAIAGAVSLNLAENDVLHLSARAHGIGTLNFAGMPIILCPDEASARAIHSSVDVLEDGTICFHKFQVRAHDILKRYRALPPSAYHVQPPVLIRSKAAWMNEPARHRLLLGAYGVFSGLDVVLSEQIIDGNSPWFGCIHAHRDAAGRVRSDDPWKTLDRLSLSRVAGTISTLAAVYSIREPFNALAGDEALRNRVIIAAMQELMLLREHEMPLHEFIEYPGGERSFTFAKYTLAFPLVVRDCPDDVRAVWTEGLQRCVDHQMLGSVPNTVNQWAFTIRGLQQFAEGVDDPWYDEIVSRLTRWLLTRNQSNWGWMPAGYFAESGPDATYNGITLHNLGWVYRRTGDAKLGEALRQCMDLFNHTVAPEPNGSWQEATNFSSRTPDGWSKPQWAVGLTMLMGEFDEAEPVARYANPETTPPLNGSSLRAAEQSTAAMLTYLNRAAFSEFKEIVLTDAADIHFLAWQEYAQRVLEGELPVLAANRFTRSFGEEFMCVRRPAYYTFLYAGSPMDDWQKQQRKADAHAQYPRNGGGLSMFWTPELGTSLLAKNWTAFASHSVIAQREDGADWEDYWSVEPKFESDAGTARIESQILNQPMHVTRSWEFADDHVMCVLGVKIGNDATAHSVWESLPFSLSKPLPLRIALLNEHGESIANGEAASAVAFFSSDRTVGEAHVIVFEHPRRCDVRIERSVDAYGGKREHGCVMAEIAGSATPGERTLRWLITSLPVDSVAGQIQLLRQRLSQP